jgi:hypothetical protein
MRSLVVAAAAVALPLVAQQPASPSQTPALPAIGATAPDFAVSGATRFGVLRDPVHLSDFKGKTVAIAFFYRARTRG